MEIQFKSTVDVKLIQSMGGDHMVVAAAKVSTNGDACLQFATSEAGEDNFGLINYLMKHRHGTPFEHSAATFYVHAPIFVWREWHRHRIGFCLAGDTQIYSESYAKGSGRTLRKRPLKELCDLWNNGVQDSLGRIRFLPSVRNQMLRVLNEDTGIFELGPIKNVFESGVKECLLVETVHKKSHSVRCSADHPILTSEGWIKAGELCGDELIAVSGKRSLTHGRTIPPSLRSGIGVWTSMQRKNLIPEKGADCYVCGKSYHSTNLVLDHVIPVAANLKMALDIENLKPACESCHREKTNSEQSLAAREIGAGSRFVPLRRKPYRISEEMTYDIEMGGKWHNFIANGIVVHNSYNEESGRYKTLDPTFYVPDRNRPMMCIPGWKPGRPKFTRCEDDSVFQTLFGNLTSSYQLAYRMYQENLALGIDPGLARDCLPVGIYSGCWVTCNPRSLMAYISLRTHEPEKAKQVSYPLWEIELAARACEQCFAEGWPLTYRAFCENGRIAP